VPVQEAHDGGVRLRWRRDWQAGGAHERADGADRDLEGAPQHGETGGLELLHGVDEHRVRLIAERDLPAVEPRAAFPDGGPAGREELRAVDHDLGVLGQVDAAGGRVGPDGQVAKERVQDGGTVRAAGGEEGVRAPAAPGHGHRPRRQRVGDDADVAATAAGRGDGGGEVVVERGLESLERLEEVEDGHGLYGVGGFAVRRQAVVRRGEGQRVETEERRVGVGARGSPEGGNVARGGDEGDGSVGESAV